MSYEFQKFSSFFKNVSNKVLEMSLIALGENSKDSKYAPLSIQAEIC